jgi:hypothetical protein
MSVASLGTKVQGAGEGSENMLIGTLLRPQAGAAGAALLRAAVRRRGGGGAGGGGAAEQAVHAYPGRRLPAVGRRLGPDIEGGAGADGAAAAAGQQADGGDRRAAAGACALAGVGRHPSVLCSHSRYVRHLALFGMQHTLDPIPTGTFSAFRQQ